MKTKDQIEKKIKAIDRAIKTLESNNKNFKNEILDIQIHFYKEEIRLLEWVLN